MSVNPASIGDAVESEIGNAAPILTIVSADGLPQLIRYIDPGLPIELQPDPGDILLAQTFWPWADLGAKLIPEQWLYMSRRVQGVIAQVSVLTPQGPKILRAQADGAPFVQPEPIPNTPQIVTAAPVAGTIATVSIAGQPGVRWQAHVIIASIYNTAATSGSVDLRLLDGPSGSPNLLMETGFSIPAVAGSVDRMAISELAIKGTAGHAMTLEFNAVNAAMSQRVYLGAYQL